ncbi:rho GTPase-activating protein 17b isoform X2 [Engraulis encrasicolus]|uniref:rho GTPase-activating protein 17b isoform X2 n=1 Tax=Engraulis encrasicolus TaxID=184585 RepID=UPI002FD4CA25
MKKQFNRMKQLANQTVGRAEKTEVLSDDLLQIERRMENVRSVSHNVHKKMQLCLQGQAGADVDKRHKKLPLTGLAQAMKDGSGHLGDESLIGKMLDLCGEAEDKLAYDQSEHEVTIQRDILDPLNQLAEVDIPNILRNRKQLARLVLDYDSAKARHYQAIKSGHTNNQSILTKAKDEVDEALNKVEICKDQLAADMYNFFSKEGDYARYYVMLLQAQADYHRRSLDVIEKALPNIQAQQDSWMEQPAFGSPLEDHLKRNGRDIALPIEACVMMLLETGMREEGLFRIAAGASKLKKLKAALDCSTSQLEDFYSDPHAVAGALKSYLRELPEPLMTFHLYDEWISASSFPDTDTRLQALWVACDKMPKHNYNNFRYLIKFLSKLAQDSDINKMTPSNIAIVLGPNLLWAKTEGSLAEMAAATSVHVVTIIEPIIQHADWFFPDDVDFNVSGQFAAPSFHPTSPGPLDGSDATPLERRRPGSLTGQSEGSGSESPRKDSVGSRESLTSICSNSSNSTPQQPQRNGPPGTGASTGGTPNQLSAGTPASGTKGPSPIINRRGTKKQAPAPPKPAQQSSTPTPQPAPTASTFTPSVTPCRPAPTPNPNPNLNSSGPAPSPQPTALPRRQSTSQMPLHAPNHPPPQPPQAPSSIAVVGGGGGGAAEPEPESPSTPTPPDTPPHDTGSLPRPKPAPRPRARPNVPPPPNPPTNGVCGGSASKIITDV